MSGQACPALPEGTSSTPPPPARPLHKMALFTLYSDDRQAGTHERRSSASHSTWLRPAASAHTHTHEGPHGIEANHTYTPSLASRGGVK
jgi:hypothetical protein